MNELALFAGAGGGILGGKLLGWRTVCAVEFAAYPRSVLLARQRDGILDPFPIWDDVRTFDGKPWRGRVNVISGGFPCQDISSAGKGAGITGARSGLWGEMARIIREVQPAHVLVENSPNLVIRGLGRVLGDLASMGYNAKWCVLGAAHCGASHYRERIWIRANAIGARRKPGGEHRSDKEREVLEPSGLAPRHYGESIWETSPQEKARLLGVAHGVAGELDGIKCCGNGQVPAVVRLAWETLRP